MMGIAVGSAAILVAGITAVVCSRLFMPVPLGEALGFLDPRAAQQRSWLPIGSTARSTLAMQGRSESDFLINKVILASLGLVAPQLLGWSILVSIAAGAVGWFWPDFALRSARADAVSDAGEAAATLFDLVVLERLANLSASQAVSSAAEVSSTPLFARVHDVCERARYEQRTPWAELAALGDEMGCPQLGDLADVMALDEQGAALSEVLIGRVKELRNAHLMAQVSRANAKSEQMTIWMSLPVVVFALTFLTPPLLRIGGLA